MPTLTDVVVPEGALVSVLIGLSAPTIQVLRAALRPIPSSIPLKALLDTGAEMTGIDPALVQILSLPMGGSALANLPAHGGLMPVTMTPA